MISSGMSSCEYTFNILRYGDRVKELNPQSAQRGAANSNGNRRDRSQLSQVPDPLIAGHFSKEEEALPSQMSSFKWSHDSDQGPGGEGQGRTQRLYSKGQAALHSDYIWRPLWTRQSLPWPSKPSTSQPCKVLSRPCACPCSWKSRPANT